MSIGYYRTETSDGAPGPLIIVQSNSTKSKHTDNTEEISRWEECPNNVPIQFIEAILEKDPNEFDKYTNKCNLSVLTSPNGSMQQNIIEYYADHFIDVSYGAYYIIDFKAFNCFLISHLLTESPKG